jgi:type I restriction enzyme S subunit
MAADWTEVAVESLAASTPHALATGPFGSSIGSQFFTDAGVPLIRGSNLSDRVELRLLHDGLVFVAEETANRFERSVVHQGDLVFTCWGTVGQVGLIDSRCPYPRYLISNKQMKLTPHPDRADSLFLYYLFSGPELSQRIKNEAIGSSVPGFNLGQLRGLRVRIPPLSEQKAIAHILGALDDKIDLNRRINQTLETLAQTLFRSWFVNFDPVRAKAEGRQPEGMDAETAALFPSRLADADGTQLPEGWSWSRLGQEVGRCGGMIQTGPFGSQLHASDYVSHGIPVVMPKDIALRHVSTTDIARVRHEDAQRLARHQLCEGDLVYSRRGDVERHALVGIREQGWLCGTGCLLVRLGPQWPSPIYVSLALSQPEAKAWISQHAIGATMPNLNTGILSNVPLLVPSDKVLVKFSSMVSALEAQIVQNQRQSETLEQLRDVLLPKLLSGELRVREAEVQLAASV